MFKVKLFLENFLRMELKHRFKLKQPANIEIRYKVTRIS